MEQTTEAASIADFLLARFAEDERRAQSELLPVAVLEGRAFVLKPVDHWAVKRVLAECEAKRRIVAAHQPGGHYAWDESVRACSTCGDTVTVQWPCDTLRALASVYADHPDYREEWRAMSEQWNPGPVEPFPDRAAELTQALRQLQAAANTAGVATVSEQPTYTLDEAERELKRRECALGGHRPRIDISRYGDEFGTMLCSCAEVYWTGQRREARKP